MPDVIREPKLKTKSTFDSVLTIDGAELAVEVRRMTNDDFDAYMKGFALWSDPRGPEQTPEEAEQRRGTIQAWIREALHENLQIVEGEYEHNGKAVTDGAQLMDIFGPREDVIPQALTLIACENRIAEAQKKSSRSLLASAFGSLSAPLRVGTGSAPASTAAAAAPTDSAPSAAATALCDGPSCGTTDLSG